MSVLPATHLPMWYNTHLFDQVNAFAMSHGLMPMSTDDFNDLTRRLHNSNIAYGVILPPDAHNCTFHQVVKKLSLKPRKTKPVVTSGLSDLENHPDALPFMGFSNSEPARKKPRRGIN